MGEPSSTLCLSAPPRETSISPAIHPGWVRDESGALRRETIHHMGRRCLKWDYCGTGCYLITLVLRDRRRPVLGDVSCSPIHGREHGRAIFTPTPLGSAVEAHFRRIGEFTPEIEVVGVQMMPDHLHGVLRVVRRMARPLGEHLRGFKIGATKIWRAMDGAAHGPANPGRGEAARGLGLFADGFTDTILGDEEAERKGIAYMLDNPRRLAVKRANPALFKVAADLELRLAIDGKAQTAHFMAIGNRALLAAPHILQVQVSRRDFAYARDANGELPPATDGRERPVAFASRSFEEKAADFLAAAGHGAVLLSPCISQGEREIARRAFEAGFKVIALRNNGFSPLYKPGGKLFEQTAAGNLLLLAPAAWPYLPGRKPMTRLDACALNRIAQLIAGDGAAEINYKGVAPAHIDRLAAAALCARPLAQAT